MWKSIAGQFAYSSDPRSRRTGDSSGRQPPRIDGEEPETGERAGRLLAPGPPSSWGGFVGSTHAASPARRSRQLCNPRYQIDRRTLHSFTPRALRSMNPMRARLCVLVAPVAKTELLGTGARSAVTMGYFGLFPRSIRNSVSTSWLTCGMTTTWAKSSGLLSTFRRIVASEYFLTIASPGFLK